MNNEQLLTLLLTLLLGVVPNLIIKWADKVKPKVDIEKTNMESADIANNMLQDTIGTLKEHNLYLNEKLNKKRDEYESTYAELIKEKHERISLAEKLIKSGEELVELKKEVARLKKLCGEEPIKED